MNLENVTVELRPRGEWEAVELGARMIRRDAAVIYSVWFALTLPALALLLLITWFSNWGGLALFIYWWLEPVTDGPILRIISRRLFGEAPGTAASLRALASTAWRNKLYWLTPYRLHFARSAMLPISQLEGLGGERRRSRAKTLGSRTFNHGMGVTAAYQHLILVIYIGAVLTVYMLMPESFQQTHGDDWFSMFWDSGGKWAEIVNLLLFYAAQSALHPWFVGAGFGLYINCRTQLEAWDIEVAFRRMLQRRAARTAGLAAALVAALFVVAPEPAQAQEEPVDPGFAGFWSEEEIEKPLEALEEKDELKLVREVDDWRRIKKPKERAEAPDESGAWLNQMLRSVGKFLAIIAELGLWLAVGLLLVLLFVTRDRWLHYLRPVISRGDAKPRVMLAGGEVRREELPDDIPAAALALWQSGRMREALALLYRGTVFAAVTQHDVRLPKSATENICVEAVADRVGIEQTQHFRRIVLAWIKCAYASGRVDDATMVALCNEWPSYYGAGQ